MRSRASARPVIRYRLTLVHRREERELRRRMRRLIEAGFVPVEDEPIELPSERVDPRTGRLLDRRRRSRG